ncbi:MAG: homoserine kinase [Gaiellaceae bacterium]|nr:homoserine kinase [Gaiellaceae bacterium]
MEIRVKAPATSANLGPGFDCAGVAFELWNELVVEEADALEVDVEGEGADEAPRDESHLGLRAFALVEPLAGKRFRFKNRIPFARGLGSSSATIALGLVAATRWQGREPDPEELLPLAMQLEPHADNLAPCLLGGATLAWEDEEGWRARRIADTLPLDALALVPQQRVETAAARAALPEQLSHADATFSAGRAALLGAALASGDRELLKAAFHDRLHEPYRAATAPLLRAIQGDPPMGAAGVTLSGSGPTVIVWAYPDWAANCMDELVKRFQDCKVLRLRVAASGAR